MIQRIYEILEGYRPQGEQEERDRAVMLQYVELFDDILYRENLFAFYGFSMDHEPGRDKGPAGLPQDF